MDQNQIEKIKNLIEYERQRKAPPKSFPNYLIYQGSDIKIKIFMN